MSTRPMVWKRQWPDPSWMGDCLTDGCTWSVEDAPTLVDAADAMRLHVELAHRRKR
jgi:hypothetical protein